MGVVDRTTKRETVGHVSMRAGNCGGDCELDSTDIPRDHRRVGSPIRLIVGKNEGGFGVRPRSSRLLVGRRRHGRNRDLAEDIAERRLEGLSHVPDKLSAGRSLLGDAAGLTGLLDLGSFEKSQAADGSLLGRRRQGQGLCSLLACAVSVCITWHTPAPAAWFKTRPGGRRASMGSTHGPKSPRWGDESVGGQEGGVERRTREGKAKST